MDRRDALPRSSPARGAGRHHLALEDLGNGTQTQVLRAEAAGAQDAVGSQGAVAIGERDPGDSLGIMHMFNLENQIRAWRSGLAGELRGRQEVLDELESHLRDAVDRLIRAGKSPELAWDEARVRLGGSHELSREFAK